MSFQDEHQEDHEILELMQRHEPDSVLRDQCCLSFEGFARFLMDKDNYACIPERTPCVEEVGLGLLICLGWVYFVSSFSSSFS